MSSATSSQATMNPNLNSDSTFGIGAKFGVRYPILTGDNYIHWKFRMEYNFRSRKLWTIVNSERERPVESPAREEWDSLDEEARQTIVMTVNDAQNAYLFNEVTAKGMWDRLKAVYQEESVANTLRLKSAFNTYKKDPKHTMAMHISKVKEMEQELRAVGVTVAKEDVILILLDSLPEEYRMVKSSLKSQKELTIEMVCARLKEEEHDLGLDNPKEEEKAFIANGRRSMSDIKCYNCGQIGHTKRFCMRPLTSPYGRSSSSKREKMEVNKEGVMPQEEKRRCHIYNQIGHLKKDCKTNTK